MLDLRLVNAKFVTMDAARPIARQLGIWRGRVVGLDDAVAALPAREEIDLRGATVLPGFIDAHVHLAWAGLGARSARVTPSAGVDAVLAVIREAAEQSPPGEWVDVVGYDQRPLGRHLTAAELDTVSAGRKVFVGHDSGHACVVNTAVLDLLPADVPHDNGVLVEAGMAAVRQLRQPYSVEELVNAIEHAAGVCRSEGVTACAEAGIGGGLISHSPVELAAYQQALEAGRLPLRVQLMVAAGALRPAAAHPHDDIPRAIDLGLRTGFGGDRLSIGALKVFTDGGMMPRTAALTKPYEGLDHAGQLYDDPTDLADVIVDGHRAGWQLAVHAIGDRAVDVALGALERAQQEHPRPDARHRVEHAGLVRPDQLAAFARVGATPVVQPNFLWYLGDDYAAIMGPDRAPWLYRGKGFLDHGVRLVGSSDRPVTTGAPLRGIQFMVERKSRNGLEIGPDERITVEAALRAYTVDAARACHWEHDLGSLSPGKFADLVVLGDDPRSVDVSRIGDIEVIATFGAGDLQFPGAFG
ncbi:amidohydrolase [Saccharopolyspora sp. K220]|uniref:amidohydrolase n=1 Tax=Saccharopolyspora soli TaxID=2926618 RepID=UPI001F57A6E8|nr:amidohydrolase [Saccharopolyspora soli]MCI2417442.1 amidohydrolase [Saccharopolyspora soli]